MELAIQNLTEKRKMEIAFKVFNGYETLTSICSENNISKSEVINWIDSYLKCRSQGKVIKTLD